MAGEGGFWFGPNQTGHCPAGHVCPIPQVRLMQLRAISFMIWSSCPEVFLLTSLTQGYDFQIHGSSDTNQCWASRGPENGRTAWETSQSACGTIHLEAKVRKTKYPGSTWLKDSTSSNKDIKHNYIHWIWTKKLLKWQVANSKCSEEEESSWHHDWCMIFSPQCLW